MPISSDEPNLIDIWYLALHSRIGLLLSYEEGQFDNERQALYRARYKALDPQLMTLQIRARPNNEMAIIHKDGLL